MLSQEIMSIHAVMGCLLPRMDSESAELVRLCRRNLKSAAEQVETLEGSLTVDEIELIEAELEPSEKINPDLFWNKQLWAGAGESLKKGGRNGTE